MQYALINLTNKEQRKLLLDYAVQIGIEVNLLDIDSIEDYALGLKMDKEKTGELVDRDLVMQKLLSK